MTRSACEKRWRLGYPAISPPIATSSSHNDESTLSFVAMSREEFRRAIAAKIRAASAVLKSEWDPIGGGAIPDLPDDEYESYAPSVVGLIERGADDAEIADLLAAVVSRQMGVAPQSRERLLDVVRRVRRAVGSASGSAT